MKKIFSLVLSTAMIFSMTACSAPAQNAENKQETQAAQEAEVAVNEGEETFIIGTMGPLTGGAASYGTSVKNGASIAVSEINEAGGVKVGDKVYKLDYRFLDDEAVEDKAVTAYNKLIDEGMNVLLGAVTSGSTLAITDLSNKDGILHITPSGSASSITEHDNVFRLCFTDPLQGVTIANYVIEEGYESVAILYNNADEYSTGVYEAFKAEMTEKGMADIIVSEDSFTTEDVDYTTQLTKIKAAGAKAIFVPGYYEAAAYITQQAKAAGIEADFIGSDGWDGVLAQVTDPSAVEGAVFLSPFLATDDSVKDFVDKYKSLYNAIPDQFAADGYDTVYVIKAAMEEADSIENAALIEAMTKIKVDGLTGSVTFDVSGEPQKEAKFILIKDGEYTAQ